MPVWLLALLLLIVQGADNSSSYYQVPIRPGVTNTITFDVTPSSSNYTNSTRQGTTTTLSSSNQYVYSFSGLPSWVTSINGSTISGVPYINSSNYSIVVTFRKNEGS